jgi:hypothetical protein
MRGHSRSKNGVASARLRPRIHLKILSLLKRWIAGSSPAMTHLVSIKADTTPGQNTPYRPALGHSGSHLHEPIQFSLVLLASAALH